MSPALNKALADEMMRTHTSEALRLKRESRGAARGRRIRTLTRLAGRS
jgi:hypothetical protein